MKFWTIIILAPIVIFIFACSEDQSHEKSITESETSKTEFGINISNGSLVGGEERLVVTKDENVRLIINSNKDLMIHLHGYDIEKIIKANQETYFDFHAHATGRFLVNAHALSDVVKDEHSDSSHSNHKINPEEHGEIFMKTIALGESFSLVIVDDFEGSTIPYHDHMNHDLVGRIIVSSESDFAGSDALIQIDSDKNLFDPLEIVVAVGSTVTWELVNGMDVVLTSGLPPDSNEEKHNHESHSSSEEPENSLMIIEVHPK